jgi:hypothetical protein
LATFQAEDFPIEMHIHNLKIPVENTTAVGKIPEHIQ